MATLTFKNKSGNLIKAVIYDGSNFDEIKLLVPSLERLNVREVETVGFTTQYGITEALNGFYIVIDNGNFVILEPTEFAKLHDALDERDKGQDVLKTLRIQLKQSGLTDAQQGELITKCSSVFIAIAIGELNGARFLTNSLTTDAVFTAGRKTYLLGLIDNALL